MNGQTFSTVRAKQLLRPMFNSLLYLAGVKLVNKRWGPCGHLATLKKIYQQQVVPKRIIDIGASDGKWTREIRQMFPNAEFLLIDPLSENVDALDRCSEELSGVSYWSGALGAKPGTQTIHVHGDQTSFFQSQHLSKRAVAREVEVQSLDDLVEARNFGPPDFIKADVQGSELEVLKGRQTACGRRNCCCLKHRSSSSMKVVPWRTR